MKTFKDGLTIDEKLLNTNVNDTTIDYSYIKEWKNVRTLLTEKYYKNMLKELSISEKEFSYAIQPLESNKKITTTDNWYKIFIEII